MATVETEKDISSRTKSNSSVVSPIAEQNGRSLLIKNNPARAKFRKSHTCGSLYANCACSPPLTNLAEQKRTLLHTYSHPDTPFIFTSENRKPRPESPTENGSGCSTIQKNNKKNFFSTKDGRITISYPKRLSSPNIGNYALLDIHPEIVLKVSKDIGHITSHHDEFKTNNLNDRRTQSESVCYNSSAQYTAPSHHHKHEEEQSEEDVENEKHNPINNEITSTSTSSAKSQRLSDKIEIAPTSPLTPPTLALPLVNTTITSTTSHTLLDSSKLNENDVDYKISSANNLEYLKNIAIGYQQETATCRVDSAAKFFQESGILGPMMGNGSSMVRKSSKIQDATNVIEQVR